jgi:8-oxo-dGTP pyrophosphatase MutT (NUDIX family)
MKVAKRLSAAPESRGACNCFVVPMLDRDALDPGPVPVPAATVALVRDNANALEVLLVRRSQHLRFFPGAWVFPGGRVESADTGEPEDPLSGLRRAGAREVAEEIGVTLPPEKLVPLSSWLPPPWAARRFLTTFFVCADSGAAVVPDGKEIVSSRWVRPGEALRRRDATKFDVALPTWVTLCVLARFASVTDLMSDLSARGEPEFYQPRFVDGDESKTVLYHGDAGYDSGDIFAPGPRHRVRLGGRGWIYERSAPDGALHAAATD